MDVCYHGRIRCWECARVQELEERVQELEQAIREALNRMKNGASNGLSRNVSVAMHFMRKERERNEARPK